MVGLVVLVAGFVVVLVISISRIGVRSTLILWAVLLTVFALGLLLATRGLNKKR